MISRWSKKKSVERPGDEGADREILLRLTPLNENAQKPETVRDGLRFFLREYYGWDIKT
jgi:hypothetical protein